MKKCTVIINPQSGRGFDSKNLVKMEEILAQYGYEAHIVLTLYRRHAEKNLKII